MKYTIPTGRSPRYHWYLENVVWSQIDEKSFPRVCAQDEFGAVRSKEKAG